MLPRGRNVFMRAAEPSLELQKSFLEVRWKSIFLHLKELQEPPRLRKLNADI